MSIIKEVWHEYSKWAYETPGEAIWYTLLAIGFGIIVCLVMTTLFYFFPFVMIGASTLIGSVMFVVWLAYRSHSKRYPNKW